MENLFDLTKAYTKENRVAYKGEIWIFIPSEKHSQYCVGLIPSNKNCWYTKESIEYYSMMRSKGYGSIFDMQRFINEQAK